jgi:hypothetical protein
LNSHCFCPTSNISITNACPYPPRCGFCSLKLPRSGA